MSNFKIGAVLFILLAILALRFLLFYSHKEEYHDGQSISFKTTLLSEPSVISNYQRLSASLASGDKIYITIPRYPEYHYGDTLKISGPIKFSRSASGSIRTRLTEQLNGPGPIKTKTASNVSSQKSSLTTKEKTIMTMFFPKIEAVKNEQNYILSVASLVRQKVIILFEKTLDQTSSSLLLGIVFGIKKEMPLEFTNSIRKVGVMHVIAASGMNITMIAGFLSSLFGFFLNRKIALLLTVVAILFYAVMSGLQPSIIRAGIMGILAFSAQVIGRQRLAFYILFLTAFAMLFVSPNLIEDIGFQLSFLATVGLLYLKPMFDHIHRVELVKRFLIGEDVSTTVAAQVSTLPIILVNFGAYSLWSVVVNGLLLWTIPIIMILGGIGAIIGIIFEPLGRLFIYLSLPFLLLFEKVVVVFAGLGGSVEIGLISWPIIIGYYSILTSVTVYFKKR